MKIIRAADCRTTPWKNGGGSTIEIAVEPPGASLDDFDWRVSMARVADDGPFSQFPDIDRTLAVLAGKGMALAIGDAPPVMLTPETDPLRFAGDTPTMAQLPGGEITDLNVMTRRGRFEHRLDRIDRPHVCEVDDNEIVVVIAFSGDVALTSADQTATLSPKDAAILTRADATVTIVPAGPCHLARLRRRGSQPGWGYPAARASASQRSIRS